MNLPKPHVHGIIIANVWAPTKGVPWIITKVDEIPINLISKAQVNTIKR